MQNDVDQRCNLKLFRGLRHYTYKNCIVFGANTPSEVLAENIVYSAYAYVLWYKFYLEPAGIRLDAAFADGLIVRAGEDVQLNAFTEGKPIPKGKTFYPVNTFDFCEH